MQKYKKKAKNPTICLTLQKIFQNGLFTQRTRDTRIQREYAAA